jgi:hypothetical protein
MIKPAFYPLKNMVLGIVGPGRLRWIGPGLPITGLDWRTIWREGRPRKFRWGWALLLSVGIVLTLGELGPAASAIITRP